MPTIDQAGRLVTDVDHTHAGLLCSPKTQPFVPFGPQDTACPENRAVSAVCSILGRRPSEHQGLSACIGGCAVDLRTARRGEI
jgi:hypothetical protein